MDTAQRAQAIATEGKERPRMPASGAGDSRDELLAMTAFLAHGGDGQDAIPADVWPASLHRFRDLSGQRLDYPLVVPAQGLPLPFSRYLDELIDRRIESRKLDGDAAGHLRHDLRRLESLLRRSAGTRFLAEAWEAARGKLVAAAEDDDADRLTVNLEPDDSMDSDARLLHIDDSTLRILQEVTARHAWAERRDKLLAELNELAGAVDGLLRSERDRSDTGRSPENLAQTVGDADAEEMDFEQLGQILERSHLDQPLPEDRHRRVAEVREALRDHAAAIGDFELQVCVDVATARQQLDEVTSRMIRIHRDLAIARLERDNRYQAGRHDPYFESFDQSHLDEAQRSAIPPVLLNLSGLGDVALESLLELLDSDWPVKVVVGLRDEELDPTAWTSRIAALAMELGETLVVQASLADPETLLRELDAGTSLPGSALLVVHQPDLNNEVPAFLQSAAALESRILPAFRYHPGGGRTQRDRTQLLNNPCEPDLWSTEGIEISEPDGSDGFLDLAFTTADFMALCSGFRSEFRCFPAERWHQNMCPISDYLEADPAERESSIPFIWLSEPGGSLLRGVPSRRIVEATMRCRDHWQRLQEHCGINNSHAMALLASVRQQLDEERDAAIEAAEQRYQQQLQADVGELSQEIVSRIAAQLLAAGDDTAVATTPPAVRKTSIPTVPSSEPDEPEALPEEEPEPDEPEASFALDDPYIDTPLCTTCDDCTALNGEMFAYDENKQAYIKDPNAGPFQDLVRAAEKCPVSIIHPGKPANPDEPGLAEWVERAKPYQ